MAIRATGRFNRVAESIEIWEDGQRMVRIGRMTCKLSRPTLNAPPNCLINNLGKFQFIWFFAKNALFASVLACRFVYLTTVTLGILPQSPPPTKPLNGKRSKRLNVSTLLIALIQGQEQLKCPNTHIWIKWFQGHRSCAYSWHLSMERLEFYWIEFSSQVCAHSKMNSLHCVLGASQTDFGTVALLGCLQSVWPLAPSVAKQKVDLLY